MFQNLFSVFGATLSSGKQTSRSVRKSPRRSCRRLCGESLERREVFSATGFSMSASGEAAILNDAKALHLSNAEVSALLIVDAVAKVQNINLSPTAIANAHGITTAEKIELEVINTNLSYSRPAHGLPAVSAQTYTSPAAIDLAFQTPSEVDAWLNSDSSDLYSTPVDLGEL